MATTEIQPVTTMLYMMYRVPVLLTNKANPWEENLAFRHFIKFFGLVRCYQLMVTRWIFITPLASPGPQSCSWDRFVGENKSKHILGYPLGSSATTCFLLISFNAVNNKTCWKWICDCKKRNEINTNMQTSLSQQLLCSQFQNFKVPSKSIW